MIEQDTVKLLRECDAGVKMGTASIDQVLDYVQSPQMRQLLQECRQEHKVLGTEIQTRLARDGAEGKDPNPVVESMSWIKAGTKLALHESDHTVADLMTDGCNMGVKSLNRYLNQYKAADEYSKDISKRLIHLEEKLGGEMRAYL